MSLNKIDKLDKLAYFMGMVTSDGHIRKSYNSIRFHNNIKDEKIFEYFNTYVNMTNISYRDNEYKDNVYMHVSYKITDNVRVFMKKMGFIERVKESNEFTFYTLSDDEFLSFLLGFIDGDGYVTIKEKTHRYIISFTGILHDFTDQVIDNLMERFNIKAYHTYSFREGISKQTQSVLGVYSRHAVELAKILPYKELSFKYYKHDALKEMSKHEFTMLQRGRKFTQEEIDLMFKLREEGMTYRAIAQQLHASHQFIMNRIKKNLRTAV